MEVIVVTVLSFIMLLYSVYRDIFIAYPLIIIVILFSIILLRRGHSLGSIIRMLLKGGEKSFVILRIFLLIGAITSLWMSSGTVPGIVYYGIRLLKPELFILSAFIISSIISILIGTSFGTVSTAGMALIIMARGGGINLSLAAGAIISGAYFGDRMSPMSSSANLVASLSETDLYDNVKNMIKTTWLPFLLTTIIYLVLSYKNPLAYQANSIDIEIEKVFYIGPVVLVPALVIIILAFLKVDVKLSMLISIGAAVIISVVVQREEVLSVLKYALSGYKMDSSEPLKDIIRGGGIISMLKISFIVFISSSLSGVFEGTGLLNDLDDYISKARTREGVFANTIIVSIMTAAFGCTQAIAIIMTNQIVKHIYDEKGIDRRELAVDIENTAVLLSPLIPWNIAGLVPAAALGVNWTFIPFAFYLYLVPLGNYFSYKMKKV